MAFSATCGDMCPTHTTLRKIDGKRWWPAIDLEFTFLPLSAFRGVGNFFHRLSIPVENAGSDLLSQVKWAVEDKIELGAFRQVQFLAEAGGRHKSRDPTHGSPHCRSFAAVRGFGTHSGTDCRSSRCRFQIPGSLAGTSLDLAFFAFTGFHAEIARNT